MSSPTPENPDEVPPKKERKPTLRSTKDSSEMDLWDVDGTPSRPQAPTPGRTPRPSEVLPEPKLRPNAITPVPRNISQDERASSPSNSEVRRIGSPKSSRSPAPAFDLRKKPTDDLGDLESGWDQSELLEPASAPAPVAETATPTDPDGETDPLDTTEEHEPTTWVSESFEDEEERPSRAADPSLDIRAIRGRLGLAPLEKIALAVLASILAIGGLTVLVIANKRLDLSASQPTGPSYPVKGSLLTIRKLSTYWREPTPADSVRREAKLIPVAKVQVEGGPCALRVYFRDDKDNIIGDAVTRPVTTGTVEISATSGLEEAGMHSAFRTGSAAPWKIQLFEAPSPDSPRQDFKKILETDISADLQN